MLISHANESEIYILQQIKELCFFTLSSEHQYLRFDGDIFLTDIRKYMPPDVAFSKADYQLACMHGYMGLPS